MAKESPGQTLQATALVHEAYLRLLGQDEAGRQWDNKGHFFAAAAEAMRRILIDRARAKGASKRGGGRARVSLSPEQLTLDAHKVRIRETFNPGAVVELVLKGEDGREIVRIPVVNTTRTAPEWLEVSFDATAVPVQSVRVILDTSRVSGWNEIDAVELVGPTRRAWAEAAYASSFYR